MPVALGFDPDLHDSAWALVETSKGWTRPKVVSCGVVSVPKELKERQAVLAMVIALRWHLPEILSGIKQTVQLGVFEGQESYIGVARRARPEDLINLATVTGAAAGVLALPKTLIPLPKEWKKGVKKKIHQGRLCSRLGWTPRPRATWCGPEKNGYGQNPPVILPTFRTGQWKHVMDAIGLAMWGLKKGPK